MKSSEYLALSFLPPGSVSYGISQTVPVPPAWQTFIAVPTTSMFATIPPGA